MVTREQAIQMVVRGWPDEPSLAFEFGDYLKDHRASGLLTTGNESIGISFNYDLDTHGEHDISNIEPLDPLKEDGLLEIIAAHGVELVQAIRQGVSDSLCKAA